MKKAFLFRLLAITFFCLATLAIKSETSCCKSNCIHIPKNSASVHLAKVNSNTKNSGYKPEAFFIKI